MMPGKNTYSAHYSGQNRGVSTTLAKRLATARKPKGLSQNKLAKLAKCTAATVNQIEAGIILELKAGLLYRLSDVLDVSARWLALGEGPMHKWTVLTIDEDALIKAYRALKPPLQEHALSTVNGLVTASSPASVANPLPGIKKPH
jgi:transcriptional regulator with XRE-family HTH domain